MHGDSDCPFTHAIQWAVRAKRNAQVHTHIHAGICVWLLTSPTLTLVFTHDIPGLGGLANGRGSTQGLQGR